MRYTINIFVCDSCLNQIRFVNPITKVIRKIRRHFCSVQCEEKFQDEHEKMRFIENKLN